jgi:crotonobetainyl-CoA:carnitine CoA-transferase CaiB-like acyl-CoA transferase
MVYVGLHGFGEDGPYGGLPAYDDIIQGLSGCAALMQCQTGEPQYFPTIAADKTSALFAAHAILAALFRRERTGQGGYVEVPMFESMVAFNMVEHFTLHCEPAPPPGYPRVLAPWRRPYKTTDITCAQCLHGRALAVLRRSWHRVVKLICLHGYHLFVFLG